MVSTFVVLALLQLAQQMPGRTFPLRLPPDQKFVFRAQPAAKQCSVPLVNAPGIRIKDPNMPVRQPSRSVDPQMAKPAPAPPCENWFKK